MTSTHLTLHFFTFLLALLGCQTFAYDSNWKGEADLESNEASLIWGPSWRLTVVGWTIPTGRSFDEKELIDHIQKRYNVTFNSSDIKKSEADGGIWIRGSVDRLRLSAYMHPTKRHIAGVYCEKTDSALPGTFSIARPGAWSVAFGSSAFCGIQIEMYRTFE